MTVTKISERRAVANEQAKQCRHKCIHDEFGQAVAFICQRTHGHDGPHLGMPATGVAS